MNDKQLEKSKVIIQQHGTPISTSENKFLNVYFMEYNFGVIGIEKDGYNHM